MGNESTIIVNESDEGPDILFRPGLDKVPTVEILASCGEMYPPPTLCPRKTHEVVASCAYAAWIVRPAFRRTSNTVMR